MGGEDRCVKDGVCLRENSVKKMPFFKYNNLTGRLAPSSQGSAYVPSGMQAAVVEPTPFQFDSATTRPTPVAAPPSPSSPEAVPVDARGTVPKKSGYKRIMALQNEFNTKPNLLVWQKRGFMDKGPVVFTYAAMAVGLGYGGYLIYKMAFPAPPSE